MANYAISGVWKDDTGVITHYAVHDYSEKNNSVELATKMTKAAAIRLLESNQNSAITLLWNYSDPGWKKGTDVNVVGTAPNKYLRTTQDGTVRDNLGHLINFSFIANNLS